MPSFGTRSRERLSTCEQKLIAICEEVIKHYDFTVLCGYRGEEEQEEAFRTGRSTLQFPNSKHNARIARMDGTSFGSSWAVDIAPWHTKAPRIRWENEREFVFLAGRMMQAADFFGVGLRWGGNWDQDQDLYDLNKPFDLVHFELT